MNASANPETEIIAQWFEKFYECSECGTNWTDCWSCLCNDRCPECNVETQLTSFIDLSRPLTEEDYIGAARLITGSEDVRPRDANDEDAQHYAEAMLEGGEYRFTIRRA